MFSFCFCSAESGWENPFRPGGDLSREADAIVELIKGGKPITPTPGSTAPPLPSSFDENDKGNLVNNKSGPEPIVDSPKKTNNLFSTPTKNATNGNVKNDVKQQTSPGSLDVQRGTTVQPSDASQVEHIVIKKKPKCKCCVIQ